MAVPRGGDPAGEGVGHRPLGRSRRRGRGDHADELPPDPAGLVLDRSGRQLRHVRVRPRVRRPAGVEGRCRHARRPLHRRRLVKPMEEHVFADVAAWHEWLTAEHQTSDGIWLVLAKKGTTDPTSLTYDEALE